MRCIIEQWPVHNLCFFHFTASLPNFYVGLHVRVCNKMSYRVMHVLVIGGCDLSFHYSYLTTSSLNQLFDISCTTGCSVRRYEAMASFVPLFVPSRQPHSQDLSAEYLSFSILNDLQSSQCKNIQQTLWLKSWFFSGNHVFLSEGRLTRQM